MKTRKIVYLISLTLIFVLQSVFVMGCSGEPQLPDGTYRSTGSPVGVLTGNFTVEGSHIIVERSFWLSGWSAYNYRNYYEYSIKNNEITLTLVNSFPTDSTIIIIDGERRRNVGGFHIERMPDAIGSEFILPFENRSDHFFYFDDLQYQLIR